ncbi:CDC48, partial [Symbiodinium sp. KB8]
MLTSCRGPPGTSEETLRKSFKKAQEEAPSILFIDEIDSIAPNREKVNDEQMRRIVATLLTEMDGMNSGANVIVVAATNRPNSLDPALRRSGRFDTEVVIPVPSRAGRLEILNIMTKEAGMKLKQKNPELPDEHPDNQDAVDLEKLADVTHGYVGADIKSLCTKAAQACVRKRAQGLLDRDASEVPLSLLMELAVTMSDFMDAVKTITPSSLRDVEVSIPNVSFKDIGGLEGVKQELREMVEMPVKCPELFEQMNIMPPKGAMLFGPPGCGKTLLAKAIANECEANFIGIKAGQMLTKWFGESEENVRNVFDKARQAAPCILFFDEMDSIAQKRGMSLESGGPSDKIVNQLLTEMDGIGERKHVFIIGATNNLGSIDPAVLRPGRLDQFIYIPMPDLAACRSILDANLRKSKVAPDVNRELLARALYEKGCSGADVAGMVQMAAKIGVRRRLAEMKEGNEVKDWSLTAEDFEIAESAT